LFVENFVIYNGRGFTTATEARWAAFFDALGVAWEYGTGGLGLERAGWCGGLFRLPKLNAWVEARPWPEGLQRGEFWPRHLAWAQGADGRLLFPQFERLFVICGAPRLLTPEPRSLNEGAPDAAALDAAAPDAAAQDGGSAHAAQFGPRPLAYEAFAAEQPGYLFCECPCCGAVGIELDGRADLLCECCAATGSVVKNPLSARLVAAYRAADEVSLFRGAPIPGRGPDDVPIMRWGN